MIIKSLEYEAYVDTTTLNDRRIKHSVNKSYFGNSPSRSNGRIYLNDWTYDETVVFGESNPLIKSILYWSFIVENFVGDSDLTKYVNNKIQKYSDEINEIIVCKNSNNSVKNFCKNFKIKEEKFHECIENGLFYINELNYFCARKISYKNVCVPRHKNVNTLFMEKNILNLRSDLHYNISKIDFNSDELIPFYSGIHKYKQINNKNIRELIMFEFENVLKQKGIKIKNDAKNYIISNIRIYNSKDDSKKYFTNLEILNSWIDVSTICLNHMNKNNLNNNNIVYRFLDECGNVLYVGKTTKCIDVRLKQHFGKQGHLDKSCYKNTYKIEYVNYESSSKMSLMEIYYIHKLSPKYNADKKDFLDIQFPEETWSTYDNYNFLKIKSKYYEI